MKSPTPGTRYEVAGDSPKGLLDMDAVSRGEIWEVTQVDDDGDVWMRLVQPTKTSGHSKDYKHYFSPDKVNKYFRPPGRAGELATLQAEVDEETKQLEELRYQLERKRAKLELLKKYPSARAEAKAIWEAIREHGEDVRAVADSLGLASVLEEDSSRHENG